MLQVFYDIKINDSGTHQNIVSLSIDIYIAFLIPVCIDWAMCPLYLYISQWSEKCL